MKLRKKENLIYIAFALILGVVVVGIAVVLTSQSQTSKTTKPPQTPNTTPNTSSSSPYASPTPTPLAFFGDPPVRYDPDAQEKLLAKKINRTPLAANDISVRSKLLSYLPKGEVAGVIYKTKTIQIEYLEALDLFKVQILTRDIEGAKNEANTWFRQQGMSQKGICDLPLGFYLNWEVGNSLRNSDIIFNPLPNGC